MSGRAPPRVCLLPLALLARSEPADPEAPHLTPDILAPDHGAGQSRNFNIENYNYKKLSVVV